MAGPVHSRTNQLADSTTGEARWNGLSPLGRQWVAEMNRLGIVIDGSHSSDAAFDQMLELSRVPIVASHSGPRAIFDHRRNLDDGRMRRLARAGGVMFMNSVFLVENDTSPERERDQRPPRTLGRAQRGRAAAAARRQGGARTRRRPYTTADFDLFMRSLLHAIAVMGVDHVGLGADWDGGGGVIGMEDIIAAAADQRPAAARGAERGRHRQDHGRQPAARAAPGAGGRRSAAERTGLPSPGAARLGSLRGGT